MRIMAIRKLVRQYASHLEGEQRKRWMAQRLTLTPKVPISTMPQSFVRQHVYTSQARLK